jgi:formate hydrogenlyase subunit 3/multisubunit Na+/H+ antiporter MnhD subunit
VFLLVDRHQGRPASMHNWLPDAHSRGAGLLSGFMLNSALCILR